MSQQKNKIKKFLDKSIDSAYSIDFMEGDASLRSYARVRSKDKSFILMDSSLDRQSMTSFIKVTKLLSDGYSVPSIIASDYSCGLALIEDLGEESYTKLLYNNNTLEQELYQCAVELLVNLHKMPIDKSCRVDHYSNDMLLDESVLLLDWYYPFIKKHEISKALRKEFIDIMLALLSNLNFQSHCLVLRDYHADNLMWIRERSDIKKVGLLDYQDAVIGSCAYDLVSLLEDARRDVSNNVAKQMIELYIDQSKVDRNQYMVDYSILGAQRNSKILGIFARKFLHDQNVRYLTFLPRVLSYLVKDLQHPVLSPLREWFLKVGLLNSESLSKALEVV